MRVRTWCGWWLVGALVGIQVLCLRAAAGAEELQAGTMELAAAVGYSVSHNVTGARNLETVRGFHLVPHLGYVLTDERGEGGVRGNLELLAEPTLIHLDASESATVVGLSVVARWVFAASPRVRPYVEVGAGVLGGDTQLRQTTCDVNLAAQGGIGAMLFMSETTALTLGYRFQHVSNGDRCIQNVGLNSSLFVLGLSYFFR